MRTLYTHAGADLSDDDLLSSLRSLGVCEGDTLFVHSDITVFGKLEVSNASLLLPTLVAVFQQSVGPSGTIVMPTFTYSWGKGEPFDLAKSRSQVGSLSEFFRTQDGVKRSIQPMHSVAAWGRHAEQIVRVGKDTFGIGSVFEHLRTLDAKIVMFGVDLEYCTFLIHVEQMHGVPYRSLKTFTGTIIDHDRTYEDSYTYFARPLGGVVDNDMRKIEPLLRNDRLLRETRCGGGTISAMRARDLFEAGMRYLNADPHALLAHPPVHAHD